MKPRLVTLAAAVSMVMCAATVGLWVRSFVVEDTILRGSLERTDSVTTTRGWLVIELLTGNHPTPGFARWTGSPGKVPRRAYEMGAEPDFAHLGIEYSPSVNLYAITLVWPMAITAAPVGVWFLHWKKGRSRSGLGCCRHCGYDLRATPDRCPECGKVSAVR